MSKISNFISKIKTLKPVYFFIAIFVISFVLIVLRRIDVITYPQFWAEDGTVWYQTAYNLGIKSLLIPHTGYFQTTSRLVALISQLLPLTYAPLFFNLCAIVIKIIPVLFIFSVRYRKNFSSLLVPVLISLIYLFLPNSSEVFANITNAHWYLAIIAFLIITAEKAPNLAWKIFDILFLILIGLSGPFIIFLLPITIIWWWLKRQNGLPWVQIVIISLTSLTQILAIIFTGSSRIPMTLGASPSLFVKITSGQIFLSSLIGKEGYGILYNWNFIFYILVFLLGTGIVLWAFIKGTNRFRLFLIFVGIVYLAGLFSPMASTTKPQWSIMAVPGNATRYWFLPMLGFVFSCLYLLNKKNLLVVRIFSCILFLMMLFGVKFELVYNPWPDLSFKKYAEQFESLPVGGKVEIPIVPENWSDIRLIKK